MKFSRIRVIDSIPALGSDLLPPGGILLIACHDNMLNRNSLAIEDFLFDFLDSPCDHGYGCKAVAQSHSSAPSCEITMAHVDGNPLKNLSETKCARAKNTHRRRRLSFFDSDCLSNILVSKMFYLRSPMHVFADKSPRRAVVKVKLIGLAVKIFISSEKLFLSVWTNLVPTNII